MSFPIRPTRDAFGPTLQDVRPVVNPNTQIPATAFNAAFWTAAGVGQVNPLAVVQCSVPSGVLGLLGHAETWNPNALLAGPTPVRSSAGVYVFTYAAQYADETGTLRSLAFAWGGVDLNGLGASGQALIGYVTKTAPNVMEVRLVRRDSGAADDGSFAARFY